MSGIVYEDAENFLFLDTVFHSTQARPEHTKMSDYEHYERHQALLYNIPMIRTNHAGWDWKARSTRACDASQREGYL